MTEKHAVGPGIYLLTLPAPFRAAVRPFTFIMFGVPGRADLLLKRPFAVFNTIDDSDSPSIQILLRTAGEGTAAIAAAPTGSPVEIAGPYGNPAQIPGERISIIGGGIGIAALYLFVLRNKSRVRTIYFGSRTAWEPDFYELLKAPGAPLEIATDDGALGYHGPVTDLFDGVDCDTILTCGPPAMLDRVRRTAAETGVPAYGSFEARMACGVGACRGCAIPIRPERTGGREYMMVCEDGPVFDMEMIDWERYRAVGL